MVWKIVGLGALFSLSACSASTDAGSTNLEQAIVGDWTAPTPAPQQPTAVSYRADHSYTQVGGLSGAFPIASASGTWSIEGTLLAMQLGCSDDAGAVATCPSSSALHVDVTVAGDTLGWHFAGNKTVWSFVRKH